MNKNLSVFLKSVAVLPILPLLILVWPVIPFVLFEQKINDPIVGLGLWLWSMVFEAVWILLMVYLIVGHF